MSGVRFVPSTKENTLSVEWSRPQSDTPILYYEIRSRRLGHSWQRPFRATTETATLRSSLVPSASYGVQVRAVSVIGEGPYSHDERVKSLYTHAHTDTHRRTPHTHACVHNAQVLTMCLMVRCAVV